MRQGLCGTALGCLSPLRRSWNRLDLRFEDPELEQGFVTVVERQRLLALTVFGVVGGLISGARLVICICNELRRADDKIALSADDPRVAWFAVRLLGVGTFALLLAVVSIKRRLGRFRCIAAEGCAVAYVAIAMGVTIAGRMGNFARTGELWAEEWRSSEAVDVLALITLTAAVCTSDGIRAQRLALLVAASVLAWLLAATALGGDVGAGAFERAALLLATDAFLLAGAYRHECLRRDDFLRTQATTQQVRPDEAQAALACGMQVVAERLCDLVLTVDSRLCVCDHVASVDTFFGKPMRSQRLSTVVDDVDMLRIGAAIEEASASHVPQCFPATLVGAAGRDIEAELLVAEAGSTPLGPRYIVGVSARCGAPEPAKAIATALAERIGEDQDAADLKDSTECSCRSGDESADIDDIGGGASSSRTFEQLAQLGRKEHWLIDNAALQVPRPVRILGSGGFGVVAAATLNGQAVAMKTVLKGGEDDLDPRRLESLLVELRAIRQVRHPSIVSFFGAALDHQNDAVALVFELITGPCLDAYMRRHAPGAFDRFRVAFQMCSGLRHLHTRRPAIVHGDLKAANILVELSGQGPQAKLIDFGLSSVLPAREGPRGGSLAWAAPESFHEGGGGATSADVFGFGWLVLLAIAGQEPHGGSAGDELTQSVRDMIISRRAPPVLLPEDCPFREECLALCSACLRFEAAERPRMEAVQEAMRDWLGPGAAARLGVVDASSQLQTVDWRKGAMEVMEACQPGLVEEVQLDATVSDDGHIVIAQAFGSIGRAVGAQNIGSSLCDLLEDREGLKVAVSATLFDLRRGALAAPVVQHLGGIRFVAQGTQAAGTGSTSDCAAPERVVARILFPDDSGVISVKLAPASPSGALASGVPANRARL